MCYSAFSLFVPRLQMATHLPKDSSWSQCTFIAQIKQNLRIKLDSRQLRNNANVIPSNLKWHHFQKQYSIITAPGAEGRSEEPLENSGTELVSYCPSVLQSELCWFW